MPAPTNSARPLSAAQERKLVDFLEDRFLKLTSNYKKRSDPSSSLQTLPDYLTTSHTLLSLILQIPPAPPSGPLRTAFLLRLTGDAMGAIPGYTPTPGVLPQLLAWLGDLDRGWLAVLRAQAWDADARAGVESESDGTPAGAAAPVSQTERTRLRSLLIAGTARLEEWLDALDAQGQDYGAVLETMGLQQGFDDLFVGTLTEMGSLSGVVNVPEGMEGTC